MPRQNISATVSEEVYNYLEQTDNKSEAIDRALRQFMKAGGNERAMIELRLEQEKSRRTSLETELDSVNKEIAELEQRLDELKENKREEREQTVEQIAEQHKPVKWMNSVSKAAQMPPEDSDVIQEAAGDMDMTPEELHSRVVEYIQEEYDE